MTGRVQDKVTVITGGASGIGEGMVRRFCSEGARVLLADIETDAGQRIADECDARFVQLDVSNERDWDALEKIVCSKYGRLDILLNNAGIVAEKSILETGCHQIELPRPTHIEVLHYILREFHYIFRRYS